MDKHLIIQLPVHNRPEDLFKALGRGKINCIENWTWLVYNNKKLEESDFPLENDCTITEVRDSRYHHSLCIPVHNETGTLCVLLGDFQGITDMNINISVFSLTFTQIMQHQNTFQEEIWLQMQFEKSDLYKLLRQLYVSTKSILSSGLLRYHMANLVQ